MFQRQNIVKTAFVRILGLSLWLLGDFTSRAAEPFPLADVVNQARTNLLAQNIKPTSLTKADYLKVISGIVNYFRHFQMEDGRIIDPFLQKEYQYSTACYAWSAAALAASGTETNLWPSAALALECAVSQLAEDKAASNHGDFFTFPCELAYECLRQKIPREQRERIESSFRKMDPALCYNDVIREGRAAVHNWNVVALSGEFLRHQNGFTDLQFVEKYLPLQFPYFTAEGLYRDPNNPMAYDHFPRHFLAAMIERGYNGGHRAALEELLDRAAWVSLLMQSPSGELPTGGRSAQHQWNEAQQCVTFEIWAKRAKRDGDAGAAKAFKRAAHLSLQSIQRWIRPSGELWIVKNRFDPAVRHGFQSYSSHSQYNLLAASMLATAWHFADETIMEGASPADIGGFAFALPAFHKGFANAGGMYVEIDTAADPDYNSSGLVRVHKAETESRLGLTDNAPINEGALAVGVAWKEGEQWMPLAAFGAGRMKSAKFDVLALPSPHAVVFSVTYEPDSKVVTAVVETYTVTPNKIKILAEIKGPVDKLRIRFPVLTFDGERASRLVLENNQAVVLAGESRQTFNVNSPKGAKLQRTGKWIRCRNGYLEAIEAEIPGNKIEYTIRLEESDPPRLTKAGTPHP